MDASDPSSKSIAAHITLDGALHSNPYRPGKNRRTPRAPRWWLRNNLGRASRDISFDRKHFVRSLSLKEPISHHSIWSSRRQALQKYHIARQWLSLHVEARILLTTVAGRSSMDRMAEGIEHMVIETVLFVAFVVIVGAAIVKAYEWRHDVLYGPYIKAGD
jgi:hypothetical protein